MDLFKSGKLMEKINSYNLQLALRTRKDIIERVSELSNDIVNNQLQENDVKLLQNLLKISCSLKLMLLKISKN